MKHPLGLICLFLISLSLTTCKSRTSGAETDAKAPECRPFLTKGEIKRDGLMELKAEMEGECLKVVATYSGGCQEHAFDLVWNGRMTKSLPPVATLFLSHNGNGDNCRSVRSETLYFDLKGFGDQGGDVIDLQVAAQGPDPVRVRYEKP